MLSVCRRCSMTTTTTMARAASSAVAHRHVVRLHSRTVSTEPVRPRSGSMAQQATAAAASTSTTTRRAMKPKEEGTISSVFASLYGGSINDPLAPRFLELKKSLVESPAHAEAMSTAFREVLESLERETAEIEERGASLIPQVRYPGNETVDALPLERWMGQEALDALKKRGTVVLKGVVPESEALGFKQSIREYVEANPQTKGFPEQDPQVYELYWSKAQLAARGHPCLLRASRALLGLFHASYKEVPAAAAASLGNVMSYCDRLRIRMPGDATFALGPHIDGGGVERWEDGVFRNVWRHFLKPSDAADADGKIDWRTHDSWSLGERGERLGAQTDLYNGPGACSVFRPFQGWMSMSSTGANEGTLRVLPMLRSASAYIILKPFFRPVETLAQCKDDVKRFLHPDNWTFNTADSCFDGCTLGRNIELSAETHPHLRLDQTMTSIPRVEPGDCVFWHCDVVHAVESKHAGLPGQDSSVLYIPAIPLTQANFDYVLHQRAAFEAGTPPPDFPGGVGESTHIGRGTPSDIQDPVARRAMGLMSFEVRNDMPAAERRLLERCNANLL